MSMVIDERTRGVEMGPGRPRIGGEALIRLGGLLDPVDARAAEEDISRSELVRRAVQMYLDTSSPGGEFVLISTNAAPKFGRRREGVCLEDTVAELLDWPSDYVAVVRFGDVDVWIRDYFDTDGNVVPTPDDDPVNALAERVLQNIGNVKDHLPNAQPGMWRGPMVLTMHMPYADRTDPHSSIPVLSSTVVDAVNRAR